MTSADDDEGDHRGWREVAPPIGVGGEEQAERRRHEHDDEDDGEGAMGQDVEQVRADEGAGDGADRQPRGDAPIDVVVGGVRDE